MERSDSRVSIAAETASTQRTPTTRAKSKSRQDNIDLLRAIAIISVLIYHYTTRFPASFYGVASVPFTFPWGHHGVDLFFAVSGFCIFMTLDSSSSLENFWARRIARIQPAYVVAIVITTTTLMLFPLPDRPVSWPIAFSNMLWFNLIPHWPQIDGAYWSLVVELKFYLLIGLIYYAMRGRNVSVAWLMVCVLGASGRIANPIITNITDNLFISDYAPSFLAGILAWEWTRLNRSHAYAIGILTGALLLMDPRFEDGHVFGVLLGAGAFAVLRMGRLKVPRPITFVGLVSYSLYLLHQNIGLLLIRAMPFGMTFRVIITCLIVIGLAALMYWGVERRWEKLVQRRSELLIGACRRSLRLPPRPILKPSLPDEMRAW